MNIKKNETLNSHLRLSFENIRLYMFIITDIKLIIHHNK